MQPMINVLIVLSYYLFSSFGLTIIALTVIIRALMYPLTMRQLRSTKSLQSLQPKLAELQKKYAKDRQKLAQEQMRLYRESGVSPVGCLVPMLVQMPVWIALYWAIIKVLAATPEDFLGLSRYLYSWQIVYSTLPLSNSFLGLDLAQPNFTLAILVGASMWVQQKMVTPPTTDPKQQAQSRMMLFLMPMMFFYFSLQFPSGLALYWVVSNFISIAMQYFVSGWGTLLPTLAKPAVKEKRKKAVPEVEPPVRVTRADIVAPGPSQEGGESHGGTGDKRQDRRTGYPKGSKQIRRQSGRGRSHHSK